MFFQPICGLCLSDCDRRGSVTSCSHFLCSRCLSRLPTAAPCPLCRRPCRMMTLDQAEVQPLLQGGTAALDQAARVVGTQLRHYQQINRRMRQALEMLHGQFQALRRQREEAVTESATAAQKVRALELECHGLREQLTRRAATAGTAVATTPTMTTVAAVVASTHPSRSPSAASSSPHSHSHRHGAHFSLHHQTIPPSSYQQHQPQQLQYAPQRAYAPTPPLSSLSSNKGVPTAAAAAQGSKGSHDGSMRDAAHARSSFATPQAATPPVPLGWSASSNIAKRTHCDMHHVNTSAPSLLPAPSSHLGGVGSLGHVMGNTGSTQRSTLHLNIPTSAAPAAAAAALNSSDNVFTPRSQAIASLPSPVPRWGGGDIQYEETTVQPTHDFRLNTPLAAALMQHHALSSPFPMSGTSVMTPPSSKPLQKLFALRGAPP